MIVLEGPDNSGKTTLAKLICEKTGMEYRRPPTLSSTEGVDDHVFTWWEEQLALPQFEGVTPVYDRCTYISDPIYRLVSGKPPLRSEQDMQSGIMRLVNHDVYFIFCLPPWEWSAKHHVEEHRAGLGLSYANIDQLRVIHWAYHCTYQLYSEAMYERVTHWDPSVDTFDSLYEHFLNPVMNHIARRKLTVQAKQRSQTRG